MTMPGVVLAALMLTLAWLFAIPAVHAQCEGDFNGDNVVTIDEIITAVNNGLHGCDLNEPRFVDNGDGTVTDRQTGLMWEQKVPGRGCLQCVHRTEDWHSAMGDWLSEVNGFVDGPPFSQSGLGGHSDWRVPNIVELQTILDCNSNFPCLDPVLGPKPSCSSWWTSSTTANIPTSAWGVSFRRGNVLAASKDNRRCVRAVRGGF